MTLGDDLLALVRAGDPEGCLARVRGLPEAERGGASAGMWKAFEAAHGLVFSRDPKKHAWLGAGGVDATAGHLILDAARVALLATTNRIEGLRKFSWRSFPCQEHALAVLRDRRPAWLPEWADLLCELLPRDWSTARALVKEGLCATPTSDGYVLGMISAAAQRQTRWNGNTPPQPLTPLFERDPDLLEHDVWRIFEVEGNRDISLTGLERVWQTTLIDLVDAKCMDRGRVLDGALAALARDFAQHKAGFYSRLHDALRPTAKELAARAPRYVALLASRIPPTVSFAARSLAAVADDLDGPAFIAAAPAARTARGRGVASTVVQMLGRLDGEKATLAAVSFLEHEAVDVVDAVLDVLEGRAATPGIVEAVRPLAGSIPASRRKRLDAWLASNSHAKPIAPPANVPTPAKPSKPRKNLAPEDVERAAVKELAAAPAIGPWPRVTLDDPSNPAPRLDPARAIVPVASIDELLEIAVRAVEAPEDRVTVERMLDGASRLGAPLAGLPASRVKPLAKRAEARATRDGDIPSFVAAWLAGRPALPVLPGYVKRGPWPKSFARQRLDNILARLSKNETQALLSLPSNDRFFVDPRALVARAAHTKLDVEDAVVALLRLAPDGRIEALAQAKVLAGPLAAPLRHALGAKTRAVGKESAALWVAAARARAPGADDPVVMKAFPKLGPDAGEAARYTFEWTRSKTKYAVGGLYVEYHARVAPEAPAKIPSEHLSTLLAICGDRSFGLESDVRDVFSLCPLDRRAVFAWGALRMRANVDWSGAEWENHVALEPLLDPDVALDDVALTLLAIGTNTKEPRENALATDALIAAIEDGRVVGPELGRAMASLWHPLQEGVKYVRRPIGARWAKTLTTVAGASPLHAEVVRRTIEALFGAPPTSSPPDVQALLEVWLELCEEAETGVPSASARTWLATDKTGKAKTIASKLLALEPRPSALAEPAHALALEARWQRAARWGLAR